NITLNNLATVLLDVNVDTVDSGATLSAGNLTAGQITVDGSGTNDTFNLLGTVTSSNTSILINQANNVNLSGDVTAATDLTISNVNTEVQLATNVDLTATSGTIDINDSVTLIDLAGTGTNEITAGTNVELTDVTDSANVVELGITAADDITVANITLDNLATALLDVNADTNGGGATLSVAGSLNAGQIAIDGTGNDDIFNFAGTVTSTNTTITINQANNVDFDGNVTAAAALTISNVTTEVDLAASVDLFAQNGNLTIDSNVTVIDLSGGSSTNELRSTGGTVSLTALTASSNALTITGDVVELNGNVSGTSTLLIRPDQTTTTIGIGGGAGTLNIDDTEIGRLVDGFSSITIGRSAGTGAVNIDSAAFTDPLTIVGGETTVNVLSTSQDNAPITLNMNSANVTVTGDLTANGSGNVDINSGAGFTLSDGINLVSTNGDITIDTTGGNSLTVNGNITTGNDGTITLTGSDAIAMDGDSLIQTADGDIVLTSAATGVTVDVIEATGGSANISITATGSSITESDSNADPRLGATGSTSILALTAGTSIGASGGNAPLSTDVGTLRITAGGQVDVLEATAVQLGDGTAGVTSSGGDVTISTTNGDMTTGNNITTTGSNGAITLNSGTTSDITIGNTLTAHGSGNIDINSTAAFTLSDGITLSSTSGDITIDTTGANNLTINGTVQTGVAGTVTLTGSDAIVMDGTSLIQSTNGDITLSAAANGITVDNITSTSGNVSLTATGTIDEATDDTTVNITTGVTLSLNATGAIGDSSDANAPLDITVNTVEATTTSGGIFLRETNGLNIGGTGVQTTGGNAPIEITLSAGDLNLDEDITAHGSGNITLTLEGSALITSAAADDIASTSGDITITANTLNLAGGNISSSGNLVLQPRTTGRGMGIGGANGDFNLSDSEVALLSDGFATISIGRTDSTGDMNVDEITFNDPLILRTNGTINIDGNLTGIETINFDGNTTLSADVLSSGNIITFEHNTIVDANVTVDSTNNGAFAAGANITFDGTIDATSDTNTEALTINAGTAGLLTFNGDVGQTEPLDNLGISAGSVNFNGAIDVSGDLTLILGLGSTLDTLTVGSIQITNTGTVTASQNVTSNGDIVFDGTGNLTLGGDFRTTNSGANISLPNSILLLTGDRLMSTTNGDIFLDEVQTDTADDHVLTLLAGTGNITIDDNFGVDGTEPAGLTITSATDVTFSTANATLETNGLIITNAAGQVRLDGTANIDGSVDINTATFDLNAAMNVDGNGTFTLTNSGTADLGADITVDGNTLFDGDGGLTLGADISLRNNSASFTVNNSTLTLTEDRSISTTNGDMTFDEILTDTDNDHVLTLTAGTGSIVVDDNFGVNGGNVPAGFTIESGGDVHFSGAAATVDVDQLLIGNISAIGADVEFDAAVNVGGEVDINTSTLTLDAALTTTGSGNVTVTNSGTATLNAAISSDGDALFDGAGGITMSDNITLTGNGATFTINDSVITLTGNRFITTTNGDITLDEVVANAADSRSFTLTAGTADVTVDDNIGSNGTELSALTIESAGNVLFSSSSASIDANALTIGNTSDTSGNVTFQGALRIDGNTDINSDAQISVSSTGSITASGTGTIDLSADEGIDLNAALTTAGQDITLDADADADASGTLDIDANGDLSTGGGTGGDIVLKSADLTIAAGGTLTAGTTAVIEFSTSNVTSDMLIGADAGAGNYDLDDTELAQIQAADVIRFGTTDGAASGTMTFRTATSPLSSEEIEINSSGTITLDDEGSAIALATGGTGTIDINLNFGSGGTLTVTNGDNTFADLSTTGLIDIDGTNGDIGSEANPVQFPTADNRLQITTTGGNIFIAGLGSFEPDDISTVDGSIDIEADVNGSKLTIPSSGGGAGIRATGNGNITLSSADDMFIEKFV
ncbi:MAG TPA: hypothetical protein QF520_16240, partial [SAR202 cluster bacterium]|nr:hypothetical protein [SAR202 cluster bacterium]